MYMISIKQSICQPVEGLLWFFAQSQHFQIGSDIKIVQSNH